MSLSLTLPSGDLSIAPAAPVRSGFRPVASRFLAAADFLVSHATRRLGIVAAKLAWLRFRYLDFAPRPDDLFIVTYPRSGTTWMQMILYQLATDGKLDFEHIYQVCPYFEISRGKSNGFAGVPWPRTFKCHLPYRDTPRGCKYLYVARNGKDVAVSYYHFSRSHLEFRGTFDEFFDLFMRGKLEAGSWFKHVKGWWEHRHDPNVLFLRYEDLLRDLERSLYRIAAFCDLEIEPARLPAILERCSFAFMKAHESKFDHTLGMLWERGMQPNAFIREGRAGAGKGALSSQQQARFDRAIRKRLRQASSDLA
jgi:hypothetical protein